MPKDKSDKKDKKKEVKETLETSDNVVDVEMAGVDVTNVFFKLAVSPH